MLPEHYLYATNIVQNASADPLMLVDVAVWHNELGITL